MLNTIQSFLRPAEQKSSRASRLIAIESGGRARWTPRDYSALTFAARGQPRVRGL